MIEVRFGGYYLVILWSCVYGPFDVLKWDTNKQGFKRYHMVLSWRP